MSKCSHQSQPLVATAWPGRAAYMPRGGWSRSRWASSESNQANERRPRHEQSRSPPSHRASQGGGIRNDEHIGPHKERALQVAPHHRIASSIPLHPPSSSPSISLGLRTNSRGHRDILSNACDLLSVSVGGVSGVIPDPAPDEGAYNGPKEPRGQEGFVQAIAGDRPAKHPGLGPEHVPVQLRLVVQHRGRPSHRRVHVLPADGVRYVSECVMRLRTRSRNEGRRWTNEEAWCVHVLYRS